MRLDPTSCSEHESRVEGLVRLPGLFPVSQVLVHWSFPSVGPHKLSRVLLDRSVSLPVPSKRVRTTVTHKYRVWECVVNDGLTGNRFPKSLQGGSGCTVSPVHAYDTVKVSTPFPPGPSNVSSTLHVGPTLGSVDRGVGHGYTLSTGRRGKHPSVTDQRSL